VQVFAGIEEAAKYSRTRQKAITSGVFHEDDDDDENDVSGDTIVPSSSSSSSFANLNSVTPRKASAISLSDSNNSCDDPPNNTATTITNPKKIRIPTNTNRNALPLIGPPKKRLRWHALVDSGMGRLGFRTDPVSKEDQGKRRDSVEILKELVGLEVTLDCPIEFYGMCTHMADASSTSTYTHSQISKFKGLLKRVRAAGISVPTISTDNSAALLTTTLTHFDPKELLTQSDADSRGFVRTGGAIYGQRPAFKQLRAVSTLMASVRHVAILKEGESVGYDRAYVAPMNVRIATLTIGFADGYPRELGNGVGKVSIRGHLFPVAGNVCMDMLMVELGPAGDKHGAGAQVIVGDTAILWGPDDGEEGEGHVPLKDLAATLKTTQSALTCGLNKERVLRQYC
jgi:alanine racemase